MPKTLLFEFAPGAAFGDPPGVKYALGGQKNITNLCSSLRKSTYSEYDYE